MALILPVRQQLTAHIIMLPYPLPILKARDVVVIEVGAPDGFGSVGGVVFRGDSLADPRVLPGLNVRHHAARLGEVMGREDRPDRVTRLQGVRFIL